MWGGQADQPSPRNSARRIGRPTPTEQPCEVEEQRPITVASTHVGSSDMTLCHAHDRRTPLPAWRGDTTDTVAPMPSTMRHVTTNTILDNAMTRRRSDGGPCQRDKASPRTTLNIPWLCLAGPVKIRYWKPQHRSLYSGPCIGRKEKSAIPGVRLHTYQKAMSRELRQKTLVDERPHSATDNKSPCKSLPLNYKKGTSKQA